MAYALLEEVAVSPTTEPPELTQDWETDSWRAQTKACAHQDPDPDLPGSVQESPAEAWVAVAAAGLGALSAEWSGGAQPRPSAENWIKDVLSMARPSEPPSFSLSQSLPSGSFHKPLIFLHQRADRLKTTITEN